MEWPRFGLSLEILKKAMVAMATFARKNGSSFIVSQQELCAGLRSLVAQ